MTETMSVLRREHIEIAQILDILEHTFLSFAKDENCNYELINLLIDYIIYFPDKVHHLREDFVYRKLKFRVPLALAELVDLEVEHNRLAELTSRCAGDFEKILLDQELSRDCVLNTVQKYIDFCREHIRKEDEGFLPLAERSLLPEDWADIACSLASMNRSSIDIKIEAKCRVLFNQILESATSSVD